MNEEQKFSSYEISSNRLKSILKKHFNLDLDGKIKIITSWHNLPSKFRTAFWPSKFNVILNRYGPSFLIPTKNNNYLVLSIGKKMRVVDENDVESEDKVLSELGVLGLGISIEDLIDIYFREDTDL